MNSEQEFRNKLKGLLDEQTYSYEDFNWEKAREVLDSEDSRKRRGFFFWILSGSGILAAFLFWYSTGTIEQQNTIVSVKDNTEVKVPETKTVITDEAEIKPNKQQLNPEPKQEKKEPVKIEEPTAGSFSPGTPVESENPAKPLNTRQAASQKELNTVTPSKALKAETKTIVPNTGKTPGINMPDKIMQTETITPGSDIPKAIADKKPAREELSRKEKSFDPIEEKKPVEKEIAEEKNVEHKGSALQEDKKMSDEKAVVESPVKGNNNPEQTAPVEQTKPAIVPEMAPVVETIAAKTDSIVRKDSLLAREKPKTVTDSIKSAMQPSLQVNPPLNYFYAETGTYLNIGWNVNGKHEGFGFNPYFGLSYVFLLSDKTSVTVGAYYYTINRLKSSKTIKSTEVVFGEVSDVTEITPTRLNYIAVPVRFQYSLSEKEVVTFGASFAYLLDVQSRVKTYHESYNKTENESTYWTGGYREGIRTFNNQLSLGYRRRLYQNLWANAEFLFGLSDIRDNSFFNINKKESAHGLKLSLTYNLVKK